MTPPPNHFDDDSSRETILAMLEDTMANLHQRTVTDDVDSSADEELQLKRARTLGYLANQYRKLKRDTDVDEMTDELDLLEKGMALKED